MQMSVSGHHVDVTTAMNDYVTAKFERIERHFDRLTDSHVILSVEKLDQKAEATVHVSGGQVYADATHENMYAAIDSLVDKLDRQIKKLKEKRTDHHPHGKKMPAMAVDDTELQDT